MRDFQKAIKEGKRIITRRQRLDMFIPESNLLSNQFIDEGQTNEALLNVIKNAYLAGLAIGTRNKKAPAHR